GTPVRCLVLCGYVAVALNGVRRHAHWRRLSTTLSHILLLLLVFLVHSALANPFYMGADTSLTTFMQQQNVSFTDNGVAKPLDQLLYDRGANLFRLRLFVNPQTTYTNQNFGA